MSFKKPEIRQMRMLGWLSRPNGSEGTKRKPPERSRRDQTMWDGCFSPEFDTLIKA
jgi:hypothetical protein